MSMTHERLTFKVEIEICSGLDAKAKEELRIWLEHTTKRAFDHASYVKVRKIDAWA